VLRLHDTASGDVTDFLEPAPGVAVSMYVCGPTVYDVPHLGHGRFALVFDVFRRYLEWRGCQVTYASNITDIDDRIIARAQKEGRTEAEVAGQYEGMWYDALDRLGIRRPTFDPHATGYVEGMVELVGELVDRGHAYQTSSGVYFSVDAVPGYGTLAHQSLESLRAGARVDVDEEKRSPVDFALWKSARPGEPTWDAPFGAGRPGWHTECVVMSLELLGEGFDLHGGGQDLAFPHHENEWAQAKALDRRFARHWMHNGFVEVGGEKMSKSLGNFTSLTDLLERTDSRAYRLLILRSHYRSPVEVNVETVADAEAALGRLDAFARRLVDEHVPTTAVDEGVLRQFQTHMDDDVDTPGAVALVFDTVRAANAALDRGNGQVASELAGAVKEMTAAVGLDLRGVTAEADAEVDDLVARRDAARAARDFAAADAIRDELSRLGWVVEDTPRGTRVHR
jgi:cysteinyl-tRNA synthetase